MEQQSSGGGRSVLDRVLSRIDDRSAIFVFPSAVAADYWAGAAAAASGAVDLERFVAWDRFVEATLAEDRRSRRAANDPTRELFASAFLERNSAAARNGVALLKEFILPEHADSYAPFSSALARSLPALEGLFEKLPTGTADPYFSDLAAVRDSYRAFLERYGLYEPSWDRRPFRNNGFRWILFLPELVQDWPDYVDELVGAQGVELVGAADLASPGGTNAATGGTNAVAGGAAPAGVAPDAPESADAVLGAAASGVVAFASADEEAEWIVRVACVLVDRAGLRPSDIAVSAPDIDKIAPRLRREAKLRDLPLDIRHGRPLSRYPAGRLFSAIRELVSTRYSYRSMAELLLDRAFPWKDRAAAESLVEFGRRFRCIAGFVEDGVEIDVWERSFDRIAELPADRRPAFATAARYYRALKRDVEDIRRARTFEELKRRLAMFKTNRIDEKSLDADVDAALARCMEELSVLAETEAALPGLELRNPFGLFLSRLESITYVPQSRRPGVLVYDYRVAAGVAPAVHFVANMGQEAATVRYDPAPFLREDRKGLLGGAERDASADFVAAYRLSGTRVVFSWSQRSASGYAIPLRALISAGLPETTPVAARAAAGPDPVAAEEALYRSGNASPVGADRRPAATGPQFRARERLRATALAPRRLDGRFVSLARASGRNAADLREAVKASRADERGLPKLSPTDLDRYGGCPYSWFLAYPLGIAAQDTEPGAVDARDLGILYHRILERFFGRLGAETPRFRASELQAYRAVLREELRAALVERRNEEGAFQEEVFSILEPRLASHLEAFLERIAARLDGAALGAAEKNLRRDYPDLDVALTGKADLVYLRDEGLGLIDYKTGQTPSASALRADADGALGDHQMAAYVRLLETTAGERVVEATFASLELRTDRDVLSETEKPGRTGLPVAREEFEPELAAVDAILERVASSLEALSFPVPPPGRREACGSCDVFQACRIPYSGDRS